MKKYISIVCLLFLCHSCSKEPSVKKVLIGFTKSTGQTTADGKSTVDLSVTLNDKNDASRRGVVFSTSGGVFTGSGSNKDTVMAEFDGGIIKAKATVKTSTVPGNIVVSVEPIYDSPIAEFILKDSFTAVVSSPATIHLEPSAFGISSNFLSEVQLTGFLKNASGNFVSAGYKVLFEDSLLNDTKANGRFRGQQNSTSDSSKVSALYSANAYPVGTTIKIKATILNTDGSKSDLSDFILLTINQ